MRATITTLKNQLEVARRDLGKNQQSFEEKSAEKDLLVEQLKARVAKSEAEKVTGGAEVIMLQGKIRFLKVDLAEALSSLNECKSF